MSYTLDAYQNQAGMVRLPSATTEYLFHGLPGEVGELSSLHAKSIRDGRKFDYDVNVKKELGDVLWFVAMLAADHGYTLSEVAEANVLKLNKRKTEGVLQGSGDNR